MSSPPRAFRSTPTRLIRTPYPTKRSTPRASTSGCEGSAEFCASVCQRGKVVAWFKGDNTIGPDLELEKALAQRRADDLRRQGLDACADSLWTICEGELDEARRLDPAGEADGRVKAARQSIDDARHPAPVLPRTPDQK